ncbi:MAG: MBL fold metallo-hydrolase [Acidimicrobiia bacterium]|nr:MBL fold metallo-hydrolase [Acidimicrobiia bacterium]
METQINEIADGIYRLSTYTDEIPGGFVFNQYLIDADEPMMWHLGHRGLFPLVSEAASTVLPVEHVRWLSFAHVEADESGSMNQWLAAAPQSSVAHGMTGVMVSLNDLADRAPRALADGEVLDLGGKRIRWIDTPHVPHNWESGLVYEETTGTLLCGDLFTRTGDAGVISDADPVGPAAAAEDMFNGTSLTGATAPTIRRLAELRPERLALMHGPVFTGDTVAALNALADDYDVRLQKVLAG